MSTLRLDNVGIVVTNLPAAIAFFKEIGLEIEGEMAIEGEWAGRVVGIRGVQSDIAVLRTPDGHGKVELVRYRHPAVIHSEPANPPSNTVGLTRIMFNVPDVKDLVARLKARHGATLIGEIVNYQDVYELCYLRGPDGIVVALAQDLGV